MRIQLVAAIAGSLVAGQVQASSILVIEGGPVSETRSVTVVPQVPTRSSSINLLQSNDVADVSRSVVMIGEPLAVDQETVAAINNDGRVGSVLRGGVFGDALPAPVVEPEPVKKLSRPAQRKMERDERRAIREAIRLGQPLPQKAEAQPGANQPATDQGSGT
jgi:hypothetical protein